MSESRGDALLEEDKFTQPLQPPLLMASPSCPPSTSTAQHVVGTDESDNDATATTGTKVPQKEGDTQELSTAAKLKLLCKAGGTAVRSLWKVTPVKGWSRSFKVVWSLLRDRMNERDFKDWRALAIEERLIVNALSSLEPQTLLLRGKVFTSEPTVNYRQRTMQGRSFPADDKRRCETNCNDTLADIAPAYSLLLHPSTYCDTAVNDGISPSSIGKDNKDRIMHSRSKLPEGSRLVMYLHGGSFAVMQTPEQHKMFAVDLQKMMRRIQVDSEEGESANRESGVTHDDSTSEIGKSSACPCSHETEPYVMIVGYRSVPDVSFPIPLIDCYDAYLYCLVELGLRSEHILVCGDSAGGTLALTLPLLIRDYQEALGTSENGDDGCSNSEAWNDQSIVEVEKRLLRLPAALYLISPWSDLNYAEQVNPDWRERTAITTQSEADTWMYWDCQGLSNLQYGERLKAASMARNADMDITDIRFDMICAQLYIYGSQAMTISRTAKNNAVPNEGNSTFPKKERKHHHNKHNKHHHHRTDQKNRTRLQHSSENYQANRLAGDFFLSLLGDSDPANPLISPIYGSFEGFPPTLIQCGGLEVTLDEMCVVGEKMAEQGVSSTTTVYPDTVHDFIIVPEALGQQEGRKEGSEFGSHYLWA